MLDESINKQKILECFDGKIMWSSLLNMTKPNFIKQKGLYNPEIVLRVLVNTVKPGTEIKFKEFIKRNALSFAFASTSLESAELRCLAYAILSKFLSKLKDLTDEVFVERLQFIFILKLFRHSVEENNQRICHVVSHFFARVSKLIMAPSDSCYAPIMAFLALKPTISLRTVPEFIKLFFSSSTQYFADERFWILRLCSNALIELQDYEIMNSVYVVESCQSYFLSTISTHQIKAEILNLFANCVLLESIALDFFHRLNFTTWIAQAMDHQFTDKIEEIRLTDLFLKIFEHISHFYETPAHLITDRDRRRRRVKASDDKNSLYMLNTIIKGNAQRILDRCKKLENFNDKTKIKKLKLIVSGNWQLVVNSEVIENIDIDV